MSRILRLLILLPVLALILPASAKEKEKEKKTRPSRTVRILFINAPPGAPHTAHLHDGSTSQQVELPRMNLSVIYKVPAGPLKLHLLAAPVKPPGQVPPEAPAAVIPETIGDAYLICISDPANPVVPLRVEVVDAGEDKFLDGQMLWFNLTPHTVVGTLGDEKLSLEPLGRTLVDAPTAEADSYPAIISYMIKGDEREHPICETRWLHDPQSRQLVFVFTEAGRRLPRILGFADFRPSRPRDKKENGQD
ncbi:MAG: hypothetical protein K8R87_02890 [Verrucomicrobia bacterium]|nr:hypothetical protein [Verrucomicrobiota bacterium]